MAVFVNREGNISMIRVGIALVGLGVLVIIGGFVLFQIEQQRFKSPLSVDLYPGAQERGMDRETNTTRRLIFYVPDVEPMVVADHYNAELLEHTGESANDLDRERCRRNPASEDETFSDYEEGAGVVPYQYSCVFNETGFNAHRFTQVTIQPGVRNDATGTDTTGQTVIIYEQRWEP